MIQRCVGVHGAGRILLATNDARLSEVSLAMISSPAGNDAEPFGFAARDFLRRLLVGNDVSVHIIYRTAVLLVLGDDEDSLEGNVALQLIRAGYATFVHPPSKKISELEATMSEHFAEAESTARRKGLGIHNQFLRPADHIRTSASFPTGSDGKVFQRLIASHIRQTSVRVIVEKVLSCSMMEVAITPSFQMVPVRVCGILPSDSGFNASRMSLLHAVLHRPQTFVIEDFDEETEIFLVSFSCDAIIECLVNGTAIVDRKTLHISKFADSFAEASSICSSSLSPTPSTQSRTYSGIVVGVPDEVTLLILATGDGVEGKTRFSPALMQLAFLGPALQPVKDPNGGALIYLRSAFSAREQLRQLLVGNRVLVTTVCRQSDGVMCGRVLYSADVTDTDDSTPVIIDLTKFVMERCAEHCMLTPVVDADGAAHIPHADLVAYSLHLELTQETATFSLNAATVDRSTVLVVLADNTPKEAFDELSKRSPGQLAVVESFRQPNCVFVRLVDDNVFISITLDGIRVARVDNDLWLHEIFPFIHHRVLNRECRVSLTRYCDKTRRIFGTVELLPSGSNLVGEMLRLGFGLVRGMLQNFDPTMSRSFVDAQREAASLQQGIFHEREYKASKRELLDDLATRIPIKVVDGFPMTRIVPLAYTSPMTFTYRDVEADGKLAIIKNLLAQYKRKPDPSALQVGDLVAAPYSGEYYRAKIVSFSQGSAVSVHFLEYGQTAVVDISTLRVASKQKISNQLAEIPQLAKVAQHAFISYRKVVDCKDGLLSHMERIVNCPTLLMQSFYERAGILHVLLFDEYDGRPPIVSELMLDRCTRPYVTVGVEYADVIELFDTVEALVLLDIGAERPPIVEHSESEIDQITV